MKKFHFGRGLLLFAALFAFRANAAVDTARLDACNVTWDTPGTTSLDSMPIGNGDIGLNVWVEKDGDLLFYVSKTDAWTDNVRQLIKVGRVRVKLSPNPFAAGAPFKQALSLRNGEITVNGGAPGSSVALRVWVDANHPVVHVEGSSAGDFDATATFETLRSVPTKEIQTDVVLPSQKDRVEWYYRIANSKVPRLVGHTFGAAMEGDGMISSGSTALQLQHPGKAFHLRVHALTAQTATPEEWASQLEQQIAKTDSVKTETAREQHRAWWAAFWDRSWVFARGSASAENVTEGYVLQRFVTACAGRGAQPIKFNGSIFTMDFLKTDKVQGVEKTRLQSADIRDWGGQYWFQNTRAMYWPMLQSGDFEMMQPLFKMYRGMLESNTKDVAEFYNHEGAYFAETKPFYGGINKLKPEDKGAYTDFYYTPILELSTMMFDYFAYTGDTKFVKETLLPIADAASKFFDQHWKRENGKLLLDPDNAIEMFWKVRNPAPDIAGLHWVLPKLLALPEDLTTAEQRGRWQRLLGELPELPVGDRDGIHVLLPAEVFDKPHNTENPELYSIFPFRIFGLGKPQLDLARTTFAARKQRADGCWTQSGIQAAYVGDVATAEKNVSFVLTRKDKQTRFPAFWDHGHDYLPDEDNGGNGQHVLQLMLMQSEGKKITLLPAWPANWDCDFKLNAPFKTTVEGHVRGGKLESYKVTPESRRADVEIYAADKAKP